MAYEAQTLSCLGCEPTMALGIGIATLALPRRSIAGYVATMSLATETLCREQMPDNRPFRIPKPKMGERIALRLAEEIAAEGLTAGSLISSEAQLTERFQTSRWTMREAISILQREGLIEIRRGRGGGLFVAEPDLALLTGAIHAYLEFIQVSTDEIIAARRALNDLVLDLAIRNMTADDVRMMRTPGRQHLALLAATHSRLVQIFARSPRRFEVPALLRSSFPFDEYLGKMRLVDSWRAQQVESVIAADMGSSLEIEDAIQENARDMLNRSFDFPRRMTAKVFQERVQQFNGNRRSSLRKPEILMYHLAADIIERGWPVGEHLGSESEMLARYKVGRSVFREAIRPLEKAGVVEMRTGRPSGLKIARPSLQRVIEESLKQFSRLRAPQQDYCAILDTLTVAVAGAAATQISSNGSGSGDERLRTVSTDVPPETFYTALGKASGNRVMATLIDILVAQQKSQALPKKANQRIWADGKPIRDALVRAIDAGDVALARRYAIWIESGKAPWSPLRMHDGEEILSN